LEDGSCKACAAFFKADTNDGKTCVRYGCSSANEISTVTVAKPGGVCVECGDYYSAKNNVCVLASCGSRHRLSKAGKCVDCPIYTKSLPLKAANAIQNQCFSATCGPREMLSADGTCKACTDYTKPGEFLQIVASTEPSASSISAATACKPDTCTGTQRVKIDGTCEQCPEKTRVSSDGKRCGAASCDDRQKLNDNGYCQGCEDYTR
jgi:hypothetical protein